MDPAKKSTWAAALVLIVATLALYYPVLHHPFFILDDPSYVVHNRHIQQRLDWQLVKWAFTSYEMSNWHPLTWISHALDFQVFQLNPAGHHATNVLLHTLNTLLLFLVLREATAQPGPSFFVAALFALHPINVESVAWVAERKNVLSMMFFLLALYAYRWYARRPRAGRYATVALLFALGLLAKPQVITLPFVLLLWDYWPLQRMLPPEQQFFPAETGAVIPSRSFVALVMEKLPLLAMCAADAWITMAAQNLQNREYTPALRLETAIVSYPQYVMKAIWPSPLVPMYPHPLSLLPAWQVMLASLFLLSVTALVIAFRRYRYLPVGWFWFLGTLVPMIGLVQVGAQAIADRYAYLPFIGLFIMIGFGVAELSPERAVAVGGVGLAVLMVMAGVARHQIAYWSDDLKMWSHTLEVTKRNFMAEDMMGKVLMRNGKQVEGMLHYWTAVSIFPNDPISNMQIAVFEQANAQWPEAIERYNTLLTLTKDPMGVAEIYTDQGISYGFLKDYANARQRLQSAVKLNPNHGKAWLYLGLLEQRSGNLDAAVEDYSLAVRNQPSDVAYLLFARALRKAGRTEEAKAAMYQAGLLSQNWQRTQQLADQFLTY